MSAHSLTSGPRDGSLGLTVAISCGATIGGFLFGYDSGVINGTVAGLQSGFDSTSAGTGFNVASMLLGCAAGAFFAGHMADLFGRRAVLQVAAVLFLISAWGSGISTSGLEFVLYRVLGGLAVGAASVLSPAYICEVAPAAIRGRLASIQQIAIITGLFSAFVCNYFIADAAGSAVNVFWWQFEAWRWMFWMEMVPVALFLVVLMLIPESPRYLVMRNRLDAAEQVLARLIGSQAARHKVPQIRDSLAKDHHRPKLADLLDDGKPRRLRTIVWVGIGLATFQQLVGINVVFYYGAVLWQSVGFAESDALLINIVSGALSIAACVFTLTQIDRIGRKPFLLAGSIGMTVSLVVVALAFATAQANGTGQIALSDAMGTVALIAANLYVVFFNASWGPVMWVMLGEMFPNQLRGSGLAISGLFQWSANFAVTLTFPLLLSGIGLASAYGLYALFAALSIIFVHTLVRETRGVELEEMQG